MKLSPLLLLHAALDGDQELERNLPVRDRPLVPAIYRKQLGFLTGVALPVDGGESAGV
jgi:hypothetical protein